MSEVMYKVEYCDGFCSYSVEKESDEVNTSIILYDTRREQKKEIRRIEYRNIGREYSSPFLNWYNLIFCSNNYGPSPDYDYMHRAVQEGKKTAATVYLESNSVEGRALVKNLPEDCDSVPYGDYMIYVFHKGCLADYFDFEEIRAIYEAHGVRMIDWEKVQDYFRKPMAFFGDETKCGFSLQDGGYREQIIIKGLLLGYPVESTTSFML